MKVLELLDLLEEEIENGSSLPLTGKKILDPDKLLDIVDDIREVLPSEFRQAEILKQNANASRSKPEGGRDPRSETQARLSKCDEHESRKQAYSSRRRS